jgi:hypothetical protein
MSKWKSVYHNDERLYDVGILPGGTLHNPRGYPDDVVRTAVLAADARRHERRSRAAKKAAATRGRRRERQVYNIVERISSGHSIGPRYDCAICGRSLDDPESITRGIGSECWQFVLQVIAHEQEAAHG